MECAIVPSNSFVKFTLSSPLLILPLVTGDQYIKIYSLPLVLMLDFILISEKVSSYNNIGQCIKFT